jgi:hypothetical protein
VLAKLRVQRAKDDVTRQRALTDFVAAAFANVATPREGGVSLNGYMRLLVEDAPAAK